MPFDKQAIGWRLASLRKDRGWDQQTLADRSGVPINSIARYEVGGTCMGLDKAYMLTDALGCTLDRLVCREDAHKEVAR